MSSTLLRTLSRKDGLKGIKVDRLLDHLSPQPCEPECKERCALALSRSSERPSLGLSFRLCWGPLGFLAAAGGPGFQRVPSMRGSSTPVQRPASWIRRCRLQPPDWDISVLREGTEFAAQSSVVIPRLWRAPVDVTVELARLSRTHSP